MKQLFGNKEWIRYQSNYEFKQFFLISQKIRQNFCSLIIKLLKNVDKTIGFRISKVIRYALFIVNVYIMCVSLIVLTKFPVWEKYSNELLTKFSQWDRQLTIKIMTKIIESQSISLIRNCFLMDLKYC